MTLVYGDESYDAKKERSYAVAALLGTEEQWSRAEVAWRLVTKGKPFHATDCETDRGDYKDIDHKDNLVLYKSLTHVLRDSGLMGFGVVQDVAAYRRVTGGDLPPDAHYYMCFRDVLMRCAEWSEKIAPTEQAKVTMDRNESIEYNAALMHSQLRRAIVWRGAPFLAPEELSFGNHRENVRLQIADLFARETMKYLDNQLPPNNRPIRGSLAALDMVKRFDVEARGENFFKDRDNQLNDMRTKVMMVYEHWLRTNNLQADTMSNRLRFNAEMMRLEEEMKSGSTGGDEITW